MFKKTGFGGKIKEIGKFFRRGNKVEKKPILIKCVCGKTHTVSDDNTPIICECGNVVYNK